MSQLNPLSCSKEELIKLVNTVAEKNGWGKVLDSKVLQELERDGLPVEKAGKVKKYSVFQLAVFLIMRYTAECSNEDKIDIYKMNVIDEVMTGGVMKS